MNTYGLGSINATTFNVKPGADYTYPQGMRDNLVTFFKMHNLTLNILGYLRFVPKVPFVSGCVRIGIGVVTCVATLIVGTPKSDKDGIIIGHWYWEALLTGIAQIARGILEAFVPFGWIINASLDAVATVYNVFNGLDYHKKHDFCINSEHHTPPLKSPTYPIPLCLLYLV